MPILISAPVVLVLEPDIDSVAKLEFTSIVDVVPAVSVNARSVGAVAPVYFNVPPPSTRLAAALVACYIGAAYWFTASTSFANPAAVFGRMMSNTFAGISPADAPSFVVAQLVGAAWGVLLHSALGKAAVDDTGQPPTPD